MVHKNIMSYPVSKNFVLGELLPPELFNNPNLNPNWYISEFLGTVPQQIRDHFGKPVFVNNWHIGGPLKYRGMRPPNCPDGSEMSIHKSLLAIDFHISGLKPIEIITEIKKYRDKFPLITTYENAACTPFHVHIDGRNWQDKKLLYEVNPK